MMRAMSLTLAGAVLLLGACRPAPQEAPPAAIDAVAPPPATVSELDAVGTEPFWSVQVRPGSLLFQRPGEGAKAMAAAGPASTPDGALAWTAEAMTLEAVPADCSDGMSDRRFPYAATVTLKSGEVLKGCAAPPGYFDGQPRP